MDSQQVRNFFAEYVIAQAIELANETKGPIKYSTGRLIRNDIMRQMGSYNFQMKDLPSCNSGKTICRLDGYTIPNLNQFYNQQVKTYQDYIVLIICSLFLFMMLDLLVMKLLSLTHHNNCL